MANRKGREAKLKGIYEREKGSNIWWIRYADRSGKIRREKAGTKSAAISLYSKRKTEILQGKKLPELLHRAAMPTLRDFAQRFLKAIETRSAEKPKTVEFYTQQMTRLLEFEPLANARLNAIDEAMIESFVQHRRHQQTKAGANRKQQRKPATKKMVSVATVNRALATLRRLLRLAHEWRVIDRIPRVRLLPGEQNREFILNHAKEQRYLEKAPQPLKDLASLLLDTGLRLNEALALEWPHVHLKPASGAKYGYLHIRTGKSKNAKRNVPLTERARIMLKNRKTHSRAQWVFSEDSSLPMLDTSFDHAHRVLRNSLKMPSEFVLNSLRHTYGTRLGEAGADAFTIMRLMGHSSVTVSQRYVHPTPEALERAVERLEQLNGRAVNEVSTGTKTDTHNAYRL